MEKSRPSILLISGKATHLLLGDSDFGQGADLETRKAVRDRAGRGTAFEDIVDEKAADVVAARVVEFELLDGALRRPQRREIERESSPDDAVVPEHDEFEFVGVVPRRGQVGHHDIGAATFVGRLELVKLERDGVVAHGFISFGLGILRGRRLREEQPGSCRGD
jgi:hypothetical protein